MLEEYRKIIKLLDEELSNVVNEKNPEGDYYNNAGSRLDPNFIYAIHDSINNGLGNHKDIYKLTRLKNNQFEKVRNKFLEGGNFVAK